MFSSGRIVREVLSVRGFLRERDRVGWIGLDSLHGNTLLATVPGAVVLALRYVWIAWLESREGCGGEVAAEREGSACVRGGEWRNGFVRMRRRGGTSWSTAFCRIEAAFPYLAGVASMVE